MNKVFDVVSHKNATAASTTLAYHEVFPEPSQYLYAVTIAQLDEHLRLISTLSAGANPKIPPVEVTFDDGHISNYRNALSALEKNSRRATFFVTAGWTGVRQGFMDWSHLRELVCLGHAVQSHGWSHVPLTGCTPSAAEEELRRSRQVLEDHLGVAVDALSLPHGRWNARVLDLCAQAGYRRVFTSNPWMRPEVRNGIEVRGRLTLWKTTDERRLARLLTLSPGARAARRAQVRAKEMLQRLLGDPLYHRLWCLLARRGGLESAGIS